MLNQFAVAHSVSNRRRGGAATWMLVASTMSLFALPSFSWAHGGDPAPVGQWVEMRLIMKQGNNWGTEHCTRLAGETSISYQVSSEVPVIFNFHVHPDTDDGSHQTEILEQQDHSSRIENELAAPLPGSYCFDFYPSVRQSEDRVITLRYRVH